MDDINLDEIICINKKAIKFERFIIRRTYGLYYLIWAFAIFEFLISPFILSLLHINLYYFYIIYAISYIITLYIAIELSNRLFSKVYRTYKLEYNKDKKKFKAINYIYIIIAIILLILFSYFLQREYFYYAIFLYIVNVLLFSFGLNILGYIRLSFKKIPFEGYIAFYSYNISAIGTILFFIISSFLFKNIVYYSFFIWIIAISGWFVSSYYAIYHAPDEVVDNE